MLINDRKYRSNVNGRPTREYALWSGIINRCYRDIRAVYYCGSEMSTNFKNYSYFYEWCQEQIGFNRKHNNGMSWPLDKDLVLLGNKEYHEDLCVFVPIEVNTVLNTRGGANSRTPTGVCLTRGKYKVSCRTDSGRVSLGYYSKRDEAYKVYKNFKEDYLRYLADKWEGQIDSRVIHTLKTYNLPTYDILYGEDVL